MVAVGRCLFLLSMGPAALFGFGGNTRIRILNDGGAPPPPSTAAGAADAGIRIVPLIQDLRFQILRLHGEFLAHDGSKVDYAGLVQSPAFGEYTLAARRLQGADPREVASLPVGERRAAFLNLYNALVMHALAVGPVPTTSLQRSRFYSSTAYRVAGQTLSLDDIEHGLLRDDRASPNPLRWGFWSRRHFVSGTDPRKAWAVPLDNRIHFALNCGAMSCPAVRFYEGASLEEELQGAAEAFLAGVEVDPPTRRLTLSMLLKWYVGDFASASASSSSSSSSKNSQETAMLRTILPWLPPDVRAQVQGWLEEEKEGCGAVRVVYAPYDWGLNSI